MQYLLNLVNSIFVFAFCLFKNSCFSLCDSFCVLFRLNVSSVLLFFSLSLSPHPRFSSRSVVACAQSIGLTKAARQELRRRPSPLFSSDARFRTEEGKREREREKKRTRKARKRRAGKSRSTKIGEEMRKIALVVCNHAIGERNCRGL